MKVKRRVLKEAVASLLAAFLLVSLGPASAFAQTETGQITVKAADEKGAVVAGATVSVKSVATAAVRTTTTSDDGSATVPNLQPGVYEVTVTGSGFAPNKQQVQVTVGAKLSVYFSLSAQAKGETITVVAGEGGVEVNTQTQELGNVISQKQITELPTVTRNIYDLVGISGNVSSDPQGSTVRGVGYSINGQRAASTAILLDGGDNTNTFTATVGQSVPLDSVQEFRVITSNFSAEYGRASGGVVNVATRAGSNSFHGALYEFNRISALASNSFDNNANDIPKGVFTRNQFGYAVGGRIIKDKLFFFSSTEWTRVRSAEETINLVPTPQLLAASNANTQQFFSTYGALATGINGKIFTVGDVVKALNLTAANSPSFATLSPNLPAFGQVRYNVPTDAGGGTPQNRYQTVDRIDWNWSDKTQIYGRYALESVVNPNGTVSVSPYQDYSTGNTDFNNNVLVSLTRTFSPKLVSQTKGVYNRLNNLQPLSSRGAVPTLYFFPSTGARINGFLVALPGYLPFSPGNGIPFGGPQNLYQFFEDLNWTKGKHQFRFGGQYVYIADNRVFGAYQTASESLGAQGSFGQALSNFVRGQLRQFQAAVDPQGKFPGQTLTLPVSQPKFSRENRYSDWAAYVNDTWRIKPRVTLNLGVRYEFYGTQHNTDQSLDSNFYFGQGATIFDRIRNGQVFKAPDSPKGRLWDTDKNNFAPRLGIAWDVFGDGKMSLRGGYGLAYERNFGNVTFNIIQNPPAYAVISLIAPTDIPSIPVTINNSGPLAGSSGSKVLPATSLRAVNPDIVNAYAHFWSAAVERQVGRTVLSAEYSGSAGRSLYSLSNINRSGTGLAYLGSLSKNPFTGATSSRLNGQFSNINFRASDGRSNYNALILSVDSSGFRKTGLSFTARYTYANAKDNLSSTFSESGNNFNLGYVDPFNPDVDYGRADFDVHHRFSSSFQWEIPTPKSNYKAVDYLVGGWKLTGLFVARSGSPFTVFDCTNAITTCNRIIPGPNGSLAFNGSRRPGEDPGGTANRLVFIDLSKANTQGYANAITGTSEVGPFPAGMTRRNAFNAPGAWGLDSALYKSVRFTERYSVQLRFEVYNVFNHANLFVGGGDADVSSFDFVPASRNGRRNVQLAAKFIF